MLFGAVSLLVVLAVVGLLATRQMRTALPPTAAAASSAGNVRDQAQPIQNQVAADVAKALQQGAEARRDAPGQ